MLFSVYHLLLSKTAITSRTHITEHRMFGLTVFGTVSLFYLAQYSMAQTIAGSDAPDGFEVGFATVSCPPF